MMRPCAKCVEKRYLQDLLETRNIKEKRNSSKWELYKSLFKDYQVFCERHTRDLDKPPPCFSCSSVKDIKRIAHAINYHCTNRDRKRDLYLGIFKKFYFCEKHKCKKSEEVWKYIHQCENYQVSSLGRVRNIKYFRIIKPHIKGRFMEYILIDNNGSRKSMLGHKIVAKVFLDNPNKYKYIKHLDANCLNNSVSNLKWVQSRSEM